MTHAEKVRPYFLALVLVCMSVLTIVIFAPFLKPLALAGVFAVVLQGLYKKVLRLFRGWPSFAAFLTVLASIILILLPLSLIGVLVGDQAKSLYTSLEGESGRTAITQLISRVDETFGTTIPGLSEAVHGMSTDMNAYVMEALQWVTGNAGTIFSSASRLLLAFFIFFIALYYLLRDGKRVREVLIELSPLNDREDMKVLDRLELAINSVIKGNLVIALVQGVLTTLGFLLFGVPNAVLWGMVASIAALIPGVGTFIVVAPAVAYLVFMSAGPQAIGLAVWGVAGVGLIDNFLGPKLVGHGMQLHPLLVLLSVLGGLMYYGPTGIFLGPLSLSLLFALLSIYADISRES